MPNDAPAGNATEGDHSEALGWIDSSSLDDGEKDCLRRFAESFSVLRFVRDSRSELDHFAKRDRVRIPHWFREVRETLSFLQPGPDDFPPVLARFGGYDFDCNMADSDTAAWYQIKVGVMGEDDRDLFVDEAGMYPVATLFGTNQSYLAVNLRDVEDRRIHEFSGTDYWDAHFNGEPLDDFSEPAFASYARMLSHIAAVRFPDGREVQAAHGAD